MDIFGYKISKTRAINLDDADLTIADAILKQESTFRLCISCGGCTSTCTAGNFTEFNIRKTNLLLRRGQLDGLDNELENCMFCGKCYLVCPHGVNTRNVILLMKEQLQEHKSNECH
jgi:heterodisulfide reductase subunit B